MFFDRFCIFATSLCILPACAGVNPRRVFRNKHRQHSPRMCGGQPLLPIVEFARSQFSPHARGSTLCRTFIGVPFKILPACAGINPTVPHRIQRREHSPRMRGGQPDLVIDAYATFGFSPACAGVNPTKTVFLIPLQRHSPRMRGGQPFSSIGLSMVLVYTPHVRGSTWFW